MSKTIFGIMPDGRAVEQYTLCCGDISCDILTYGGTLRALRLPDRQGTVRDVLLGWDRLEDYFNQTCYMGALVGRYANRIGKGVFTLNGREYILATNDGDNHLHGGNVGFDKRIWNVEEAGEDVLVLSLHSPDGEEGYPGNLDVKVEYRLGEKGLSIDYFACCDQDTIYNLTNHAYFNLNGQDSGSITTNCIQLMADHFTPTDSGSIPDGRLEKVEGTPMDLREMQPIGRGVDADFEQLRFAGGYDHNWVLNGEGLKVAARAFGPDTGICMEVLTTQPGIQFYSGNYMDGCPAGKGGALYAKRWGYCLETQHFPNSPNCPQYPSTVLHAGEKYISRTEYNFSIVQDR